MTTSNKQKAELGIYWFSYDLYDNGVDDLSAYLVKPEPTGDNIILVKTIDYNRYEELEQKLVIAVAALKKSRRWLSYNSGDEKGLDLLDYTEQTLASLGESEVGEG